MANYTLNYTGEKVDELLNKIDTAFGEETVTSDILTWDGDTDGLTNVLGMFYHVSDAIPTLTDLQQGGSVTLAGSEMPFTASDVMDMEAYGMGRDCYLIMVNNNPCAGIVLKAGATATMEGMTANFEKAGIYFLYNAQYSMYTSSLAINNYQFTETEITPIEPKYVPFSGVSFVDITGVSFTDNSFTNAKANKTYEEIMAMISQGRYVVARIIDGEIIGFAPAILAYGNAMINFALLTDGKDWFISLLSDNSISAVIK